MTPGPGQVLFSFVRHWSRRTDRSGDEQGRLVVVTEAVQTLTGAAVPATVNAVADELGVDQSGASRLLRRATEAGYLTVQAAPADGRHRLAALTPLGQARLEQAHAWQEQVFARLTEGWSEQRRQDFRAAMTELVARSYAPA